MTMPDNKTPRRSGLTINTWLLAFASLFADISTEMLYPVIPTFVTQTLKSGGSVVGIIEGFAVAIQNIVQGFSGWISDKLQRRKPIALLGYAIAAMSKPLIGLSTVWQGVLGARSLDRLGTGTRSAPRDALIAASADEKSRGAAFGLEGIGDNLGAFLGPLLTILLLSVLAIEIRSVFLLAFIPGMLAFFMILLVKEGKSREQAKSNLVLNVRNFPADYWKYLGITALFGIGNSANSFLILQTQAIGASLPLAILIYAFFNLVAALISYPSGSLSDRFGRKNLLLIALIIFFIAYAGFALSHDLLLIGFLFVFYGLYQGMYRAVGKSFASDFFPAPLRASGIGWYSATVGLSGLLASIVAGQLWDKIGHEAVFIYGAVFAALAVMALVVFRPAGSNQS
jgi:MFS family permease